MRKTTRPAHRRRKPGEMPMIRQTIRNHCYECTHYELKDIRGCTDTNCQYYAHRLGYARNCKPGELGNKGQKIKKISGVLRRPLKEGEIFTPAAAIRNFCLRCCNGSTKEVRECPAKKCWNWPRRLGYPIREENCTTRRKSPRKGRFLDKRALPSANRIKHHGQQIIPIGMPDVGVHQEAL